jgi:hypothetical protein
MNKPLLRKDTFDLGVGCAILHHLFDPAALIASAFASIKPGRSLIFYEPFEPGNQLLASVVRQIIMSSNGRLDKKLLTFLERRIQFVKTMRCEPKDEEKYAAIDDKWMFTRTYFQRVASHIGAVLTIYPINSPANPFRSTVTTWLRIGLRRAPDALPQWAWEIIDEAQAALSLDCREDSLMAGCVIFTKPGT